MNKLCFLMAFVLLSTAGHTYEPWENAPETPDPDAFKNVRGDFYGIGPTGSFFQARVKQRPSDVDKAVTWVIWSGPGRCNHRYEGPIKDYKMAGKGVATFQEGRFIGWHSAEGWNSTGKRCDKLRFEGTFSESERVVPKEAYPNWGIPTGKKFDPARKAYSYKAVGTLFEGDRKVWDGVISDSEYTGQGTYFAENGVTIKGFAHGFLFMPPMFTGTVTIERPGEKPKKETHKEPVLGFELALGKLEDKPLTNALPEAAWSEKITAPETSACEVEPLPFDPPGFGTIKTTFEGECKEGKAHGAGRIYFTAPYRSYVYSGRFADGKVVPGRGQWADIGGGQSGGDRIRYLFDCVFSKVAQHPGSTGTKCSLWLRIGPENKERWSIVAKGNIFENSFYGYASRVVNAGINPPLRQALGFGYWAGIPKAPWFLTSMGGSDAVSTVVEVQQDGKPGEILWGINLQGRIVPGYMLREQWDEDFAKNRQADLWADEILALIAKGNATQARQQWYHLQAKYPKYSRLGMESALSKGVSAEEKRAGAAKNELLQQQAAEQSGGIFGNAFKNISSTYWQGEMNNMERMRQNRQLNNPTYTGSEATKEGSRRRDERLKELRK